MFDMAGFAVEVGQALLALALAPALVGLIRWMKARMQNRRGAPFWQPYAELRKLFRKDMVVSRHASWIFHLAPFVIFAGIESDILQESWNGCRNTAASPNGS